MASGSSIVHTRSDVIIPTGLANSKCRPCFIFTLSQAIIQTNATEQRQIAALEQFAADPDLTRLLELAEEQCAEFDAIDFLGLSDDEEFHSNFLAWLLNPRQNHVLCDYFLRGFLLLTGAHTEVGADDWLGTSVHREWRNEVDGQPG